MRALVITCSNRAAAGVYEDRGGPILQAGLVELGFEVDGPQVVPDGEPVWEALTAGVAAGYDVILTTGGTGLTPGDHTPEVTRRVIEREVPGIADAIRMHSRDKVPASVLSRGLAGVAGRVQGRDRGAHPDPRACGGADRGRRPLTASTADASRRNRQR